MRNSVTPLEAGFDGAVGFRMPLHGESFRVYLKRGTSPPSDYPGEDWAEQLLWWYPPEKDAKLLWCNAEGKWFDLRFCPIEQP